MLTKERSDAFIAILREELVSALGCTEPIAIAYAAAVARKILGRMPQRMEISCSGNIVKNVKGVKVPNTGGLKGIQAAGIAGLVAGDPDRGLEVLENVRPSDYPEIERLLAEGLCSVSLAEGVENLYILVRVFSGVDRAELRIEYSHMNVVHAARNGIPVDKPASAAALQGMTVSKSGHDRHATLLDVESILEFARTVDLRELEPILSAQIALNTAISDEGLAHSYGADVGKTLLKYRGNDVRTRAAARPAAGSDARMSGCSLPVVINSGSGNQGLTVSLPVVEYAKEMGAPREALLRALVLSNLTAIHQKALIGKLSAFCGAVSAACGSGAGIALLRGGGYERICDTITNTL
ncbi:MAG: L-serine ammonia-lyase, iron-sulfur-dependent, subunit alpha, partial [Spirochaetaceae bacterium]|nr:L-serine ammonia-lyase, iron-sulfur-dependent, subunit alpha [Spirochaetaceae bacterium]